MLINIYNCAARDELPLRYDLLIRYRTARHRCMCGGFEQEEESDREKGDV